MKKPAQGYHVVPEQLDWTICCTYTWSDRHVLLTWHHAAHDKEGQGGLWAPRLVTLFLGGHLSLPECILQWEALLNDVLQSDCDRQLPANMQHLYTQCIAELWQLCTNGVSEPV